MIVVKIGGGKEIDYDAILSDISKQKDIVVVHGGNYQMKVISEKLGKEQRMITSVSGHESRYTDKETMEIFEMVYCGKMNKMIVEKLHKLNVNAVGLSGMDGKLLEGYRKTAIKIVENGKKKVIRDDYSGKIEKVNVKLLNVLIENGFVPVITPPAISYENEAINVDGDRVAAEIAKALNADVLVILSNIPGLLKDAADESTLIKSISRSEIESSMEYAKGRMKRKVLGAAEALDGGVKKVIFGDARVEEPVTKALNGNGTVICQNATVP